MTDTTPGIAPFELRPVEEMTLDEVNTELAELQREDPDGFLLGEYFSGALDPQRTLEVEQRLDADPEFALRAEPYFLMHASLARSPLMGPRGTGAMSREERKYWRLRRLSRRITFAVLAAIAAWLLVPRYLASTSDRVVVGAGGGATTYAELDRYVNVWLAPGAVFSYTRPNLVVRTFVAPTTREASLVGDAEVRADFPATGGLHVRTPLVALRTQRGEFRVRVAVPCTTLVHVTRGSVTITPNGRADSLQVFAPRIARVECDQTMKLLPPTMEVVR